MVLSYLKGIYKGRPVTILTTEANKDLSSTKTRRAIKREASLADMVDPRIDKIINKGKPPALPE